jgi:type II secretory pathway component PulJ
MIILNQKIISLSLFNKKKIISGFSLVEILVYLAIFVTLSILIINLFIVILSTFHFSHINRKLLESGMISMERIAREVRQANSIDINSTSNQLILHSLNSLNQAVITTIEKENNNLYISINNTIESSSNITDVNLLDQKVLINFLNFIPITTPESQAVKIEMSLEYGSGGHTKIKNFYNTIILRGSY